MHARHPKKIERGVCLWHSCGAPCVGTAVLCKDHLAMARKRTVRKIKVVRSY